MGQNEHCLGEAWAGTPEESRMHYNHWDNENNYNKSAGETFESAIIWYIGGRYSTGDRIPPTKAKSENSRNWI